AYPSSASWPPLRLKPKVATASPGRASAGSCVAGSMTRSGRMTTHAVSTTKITRASAAMPGVVSVRPPHDVGDNELPIPLPVIWARMHAALKIAKTSVSNQAERSNLTVRMYSTPSGHAVAISTNDPNKTATPRVISSRDKPSGPPDPELVSVVVPVGVWAAGAVVATLPGVDPTGVVVATGARLGVGSLATVKLNVELPALAPLGSVTSHDTTHSPFGNGLGTVTLSVTPSAPTCGVPTAIGEPPQTTCTSLVAPSGLANVMRSVAGDTSTVDPAAGDDDTSELSTACARPGAPAATAMPAPTSAPKAVGRRRRNPCRTARPMAR